jgi:hypothetical protein
MPGPVVIPDCVAPIGRFVVRAAPLDVAAFRQAVDVATAATCPAPVRDVPCTYPITWLTLPEVRAAVRAVPAFGNALLVQTAQRIVCHAAVQAGARYAMAVGWRENAAQRQLLDVVATVTDESGADVVHLVTTLKVLSRTGDTP